MGDLKMIHKVIKSDGKTYFIHATLWGGCVAA